MYPWTRNQRAFGKAALVGLVVGGLLACTSVDRGSQASSAPSQARVTGAGAVRVGPAPVCRVDAPVCWIDVRNC